MIQKNTIDVIIIAKNEASRIASCMSGVAWANHIFVIDNDSAAETAGIARKNGAHVIKSSTDNFSELRELGAQSAQSEWLFYLDADESVTIELRDEILKIVRNQADFDAYTLPRKNYYLGFPWPYRDGMVRLMKKDSLTSWAGKLHESAVVQGNVGKLKNYVIHTTHRNLEEMVDKTNIWSSAEAGLRFDKEHPPVVWWRFLRVMFTGFWSSFITQNGWKAGTVGWIESMYQAFSMFITYAKLWELQQKQ